MTTATQRRTMTERHAIIIRDLLAQRPHNNAELAHALMAGPVTGKSTLWRRRAITHLQKTGHSVIGFNYDRHGNIVLGSNDWGWWAFTNDGALLVAHQRRSNQRNYSERVNNWRSLRGHVDRFPTDVVAMHALQDEERAIFALGQSLGKSLTLIGSDLRVVILN